MSNCFILYTLQDTRNVVFLPKSDQLLTLYYQPLLSNIVYSTTGSYYLKLTLGNTLKDSENFLIAYCSSPGHCDPYCSMRRLNWTSVLPAPATQCPSWKFTKMNWCQHIRLPLQCSFSNTWNTDNNNICNFPHLPDTIPCKCWWHQLQPVQCHPYNFQWTLGWLWWQFSILLPLACEWINSITYHLSYDTNNFVH